MRLHSFCYTQKSNVNNNLYLIPKSLHLVILYNQNILGKYTLYLKPLTGPLQCWDNIMLWTHNVSCQANDLFDIKTALYHTAGSWSFVLCWSYTVRNEQFVALLMKTGLGNVLVPTLFTVVNNIVQYWYTRLSSNNTICCVLNL